MVEPDVYGADLWMCFWGVCLDWVWERGVQARIWTCSNTKYDVPVKGLS